MKNRPITKCPRKKAKNRRIAVVPRYHRLPGLPVLTGGNIRWDIAAGTYPPLRIRRDISAGTYPPWTYPLGRIPAGAGVPAEIPCQDSPPERPIYRDASAEKQLLATCPLPSAHRDITIVADIHCTGIHTAVLD